jgi:MFS family permease
MTLNSLPLGFTLVVLPIYLSEIGFSAEAIGVITSASSIANTLALIPFAIAADRYGRKIFVVSGFSVSALAYILFGFTRNFSLLLLASAIGGVMYAGGFSAAIWTPAWTALLTEKTGTEGRTGAFAWSQGMWTIALTTGSLLSVVPILLQNTFKISIEHSFQYIFIVFAGVAIISGITVLPVSQRTNDSPQAQRKTPWNLISMRSFKHISKFSIVLGLVGFASGFSVQLLSLWFNKMYRVDESTLGPWFAAAEITSLVVVPIIPRLTRALGSSRSVFAAQGLSAFFLSSMVLAPTYQIAGILFIIRNLFMNISWPVQQSYLMGTVPSNERASASAITSMIWGIGNSFGPFLAGIFLSSENYFSISMPLTLGGGIYLASAIAFYLFFRKIHPPEEMKG